MKKRLFSIMLVLSMVLSLFSLEAFAATNAKETNKKTEKKESKTASLADSETITRAEWIHELVETFDLSVDEEEYPDNYYSDVTEQSSYYYDVMAATWAGIIAVEAGDALNLEDPLTREFAAQTMNQELGILCDSDDYSFSDSDDLEFPDDAQVAVENGWFELVEGKFLPKQAVSLQEYNGMLTYAREELNARSVEEAKQHFEFADYVIELPETAEISAEIDWENNVTTLTISGYQGTLKENDTFVYFSQGLAFVYSVSSVEKDGDNLIVITKDAPDDAIAQYECVGEIAPEFEVALPEDNEEIVMMSSEGEEVVIGKAELAGVDYDKDTVSVNRSIKVGGITGTITVVVDNIKLDYSLKKNNQYIAVIGDLHINSTLKVDLLNDENAARLPLAGVNLLSFGYVGIETRLNMAVGVGCFYEAHFRAGAARKEETVSAIREITPKGYSITAEGEASAAIAVTAHFRVPKLASAKVELSAGPEMKASAIYYSSGSPSWCMTMYGYLKAGVYIYAEFTKLKPYSKTYPIYTLKNSPVRIYVHVEEGKEVDRCSRPNDPGRIVNGYKVPRYLTRAGSRFYGGWSNTSGSWGDTAEPIIIWETEDNEDGTVTIVGYHGNAAALNIPETIDDKTVSAIGAGVFADNQQLRIVTMPDTITRIGENAFNGCTNMSSINFSKKLVEIGSNAFASTAIQKADLHEGLTTLGNDAFYSCKSLSSVFIPTSLTDVSYDTWSESGVFGACSKLNDIKFGEAIKTIPSGLFMNCDGLTHITIPNTVTTVGNDVFHNCTNLKSVVFSNSLTEIGDSAFEATALKEAMLPEGLITLGPGGGYVFRNCSQLEKVYIPASLQNIGAPSGWITDIKQYDESCNFGECPELNSVVFGEAIKKIPDGLFANCNGLKTIEIPDTVTNIGQCAFFNCTNLKNVTFGESITEIGSSAFSSTGIQRVILPEGLLSLGYDGGGGYVFADCKDLEKVYIPSTLVDIGAPTGWVTGFPHYNEGGTFSGCSSLAKVEFGESIERIHSGLFANCDGPMNIVIPDTVREIGEYAFSGSGLTKITIPDNVTSYEYGVFNNCAGLVSVTLSKKALDLPEGLFSGCSSLKKIVIPDGVNEIKEGTFRDCTKLEDVTLPVGLTAVKFGAFENCDALKTVEFLPYTVTSLGENAFYSCSGLISVDLPDLVSEIGKNAFADCEKLTKFIASSDLKNIGEECFASDVLLSEVRFNEGLRTIGSKAFTGCTAIEEISLPDTVTELGTGVFENDTGLKSVHLSKGLKVIPSYAFSGCDNKIFKSIVIPVGVETIEDHAFYNDVYLLEFSIPATVTSIGDNAFSYIRKTTVNGVSGSYAENWSTVHWKAFNDISVPAQEIHLKHGVDEMTIGSPYAFRPEFEILPENSSDFVVKLESADSNIVSVGDDMELYAGNEEGETTVTATTYHNQTYTFKVKKSELVGFEIGEVPTKQKLDLKENKKTSGLIINAVFENGDRSEWYEYDLYGYTTDIAGEHIVQVSVDTMWAFVDDMAKNTNFSIYVDTEIAGKIGKNEEVSWTDTEEDPDKIRIDGPVSSEEPIFIASYDKTGRLIAADKVVKGDSETEIARSSKVVKIIWLDVESLPKCKNARIIK